MTFFKLVNGRPDESGRPSGYLTVITALIALNNSYYYVEFLHGLIQNGLVKLLMLIQSIDEENYSLSTNVSSPMPREALIKTSEFSIGLFTK